MTSPLLLRRSNKIEQQGWVKVLSGLSACRNLAVVNCSGDYAQLLAGGCTELNLAGREIALAADRFLALSAATLRVLDLRSASFGGVNERCGHLRSATIEVPVP